MYSNLHVHLFHHIGEIKKRSVQSGQIVVSPLITKVREFSTYHCATISTRISVDMKLSGTKAYQMLCFNKIWFYDNSSILLDIYFK